ncbi:hypothetical protein QBC47DRAFT_420693 [Echria macrotheca]|uniref:Peptidase A1 domain-containing protein n=1 Tax=Echria macrotheca TaxID=438768 RepID=A0AAJ0FG72_9PEZI|nr:hypothetical protein QBC47DRAFT_420693 [Echria macrotheca]
MRLTRLTSPAAALGITVVAVTRATAFTRADTRVGFYDAVTPHYVAMDSHAVPSSHDLHVRRRDARIVVNGSSSLVNVHDVYYIIDLDMRGEKIPVTVDTGSSDTWVVKQPYECISLDWEHPERKPNCGLGDGLKGDLSGGVVANVSFGRAYVDGTFVSGYFGYEDVTLAGLTAKHQRLAIVNSTYWYGDGRTSGLLGLAYPYMTSLDGADASQPLYDPIFTTLWKDKLIDPVFSMALSRAADQTVKQPAADEGHETSYLAFGGLPPVSYDAASWARTPILPMSAINMDTQELGLYLIRAESFVYGQKGNLTTNGTAWPVLIDAGSTLSVLPRSLVDKLYAAFDPPAKYMSFNGLFYARCDAKVPEFGVTFGNRTFFFAKEDLLRQSARDPTGEYCRIGVTDGPDDGSNVLGVTFLSSVVAVFDIGLHEMRFASRVAY